MEAEDGKGSGSLQAVAPEDQGEAEGLAGPANSAAEAETEKAGQHPEQNSVDDAC